MQPRHATINTSNRPHKSMPHPLLQGFHQQRGGRRDGRGRSQGGHARRGHGRGGRGIPMPTNQFMGGNMIPYILANVQPPQQWEHICFSNIVQNFANRMSATAVGLMWKIGTRVPHAIKRNGATRRVSIAQTTRSTNVQTTPSAAKQCTRLCTQAFDGVGR
jgi:hypothetical protein